MEPHQTGVTERTLACMWDTVESFTGSQLSHDRPCGTCGHALHSYLPCSDSCDCTPALAPGGAVGHRLTPA